MQRRKTRQIFIGNVPVGGDAPVVVQSMTNSDTRNVPGTLDQIRRLAEAGCEIVRVAVPDDEAAQSLKEITRQSPLPVIADIHFDYRLALKAMDNGVAGLRLNPGNIGGREKVRAVVNEAKGRKIPIRIGVNAGSLEKKIIEKYGGITAEGMVESALNHVHILEDLDFYDIKISLKTFEIPLLIQAYRMMAEQVDYPLHIGVTEAGTIRTGTIRSAVGIGALLSMGIGDTVRVSLTGDPVEEVWVAYEILKSLHLRERGPTIVSCPTCGRTQIDLIPLAEEVEKRLHSLDRPLKVAIMGCVVNGPGEAREADIGIAGGRGVGILFRKGEIIKRVKEENLLDELMEEIKNMCREEKE
ncbi:1-hydroxy-2-methyl-2-(E)-butenyl 4-diphosphate synthase [Thermincola ferriacetica]|uniref:4-hydroxy-3-methylbut-2-en-1-yl diphosphate synthase (flavodoxin) n=2 Tax=Thermincola TaxID=278993 RepID=D5XF03_THEPJ|nr:MULTISPECIES: flavodoxin-dependent (E)-4-hydroxy-3-methylbut-2-enyl-diphosphate synthase [Thermincola]ADG82224.1 1-hydroxy-2-methyl-2-(E)-butenyl 4-diphosphate synthase [Thermincola potens JR]KNZ71241.1 1-hydroxy-2-methyl-2-(E)-butenyl 4-diphosphate synthase [Thermincola ferriacetica]